jgi:hypothetical protein
MFTLAGTNLTTLLDRDFVNFKVPPAEREQMTTLILLRQLQNPIGLSISARRALAVSVAKGLDGLLPKANDPELLKEQANELFSNGIVPTVTELEYFGENPAAQAQLNPVAQTAKRMFRQVSVLAGRKVETLGNSIKTNADLERIRPMLLKMRTDQFEGDYSDNMATYALCISLPKSDPQRKIEADKTIKYLAQYDNPTSTVQPTIRLQIGKLQLVEGDYAAAEKTFEDIANLKDITPLPTVGDQNNARYFSIVAQISARQLNDAQARIPDLENWEVQTFLPTLSPGEQAEVKASLAMLKFRLYSAQSDLTNDVNVKKQTNDQAIDVLSTLLKEQPGLKDLVYDQLIGRIPVNPDLPSLNPLVLLALEQQGFDEVVKPDGQPVDEAKLTRAIAAAKEIISRKTDEAMVQKSTYFIAYAYQRLNMDKEAAAAFMDFAQQYPNERGEATDSIDHATALIGKLKKQARTTGDTDPDIRNLYDRFLPLVINPPYNRKKFFAFQYAAILQTEKKPKEAVNFFKQVPDSDPQYALAQYLQLLALAQEVSNPDLSADDRKQVTGDLLAQNKVIDNLLTSAKTDADRQKYVQWVITSDEIGADAARAQLKDPARSLSLLEGFESRISSAAAPADADKAHVQALQLRISDYMDLGKVDEATKTLVDLMNVNQAQGQGLMFDVLKTVGHDMDVAKAEHNTAELKKLAVDQAQLSGFVVDWASKNKDPKVQAALPQYQLFDADSKREAAELVDDPAARNAALTGALKTYQALYNFNKDNAAAEQGVGLVQYDMGNFQAAADALSPLVTGKKIGEPTIPAADATGVPQENTAYWETNYKLIKSLLEVCKKTPTDPAARQHLSDASSYLGGLYIINGKKTGGTLYHEDFDKLKTDIAAVLGKK